MTDVCVDNETMTEFGKLKKLVAAFRMIFAIGVCQLWPAVRPDDVNNPGIKGNISLIRLQIHKRVNLTAVQENPLPVKSSAFKLPNTTSENPEKQNSEKRSEIYVVHNGLLFLHPRKVMSATGVRKSSGEDSSSSINYHVIKKSNINTTGRIMDTDLLQIGMVSRGAVTEEPKSDIAIVKSKRDVDLNVIDETEDTNTDENLSLRKRSDGGLGLNKRVKSSRSVLVEPTYTAPQNDIGGKPSKLTLSSLAMQTRTADKRQIIPKQIENNGADVKFSSFSTGRIYDKRKYKRMSWENPIFDEEQPENREEAWKRRRHRIRHRRHRKHHRRHHLHHSDPTNLRHIESIKNAYPLPRIGSISDASTEALDSFTEYPRFPKDYDFKEMPRFPHPKSQLFIYPRFPHPKIKLENYPKFPAIKPIEELGETEEVGSKRSPEILQSQEPASQLSSIPRIERPEKIPDIREIPQIPDIPDIPGIPFLRSIPSIHDIKPIPPAEALKPGDVSVTNKAGIVKTSSKGNS